MSDIAFALNYTNIYMLDVTPDGPARTWERLGCGINNVAFAGNEEVSEEPYYDGDGVTESDVTGGRPTVTFSGHRNFNDPAQNYVAGLEFAYGAKRRTNLRRIAPDGSITEGEVTIANITPGGGSPNAKGDFSFEARFNGMPSVTPGDADAFPESISAPAVAVKVGETARVEVSATPAKASPAAVYGIEDESIATVDAAGVVTGVKAGKTKLSAKSAVLPSVRVEVDVTVTAKSS